MQVRKIEKQDGTLEALEFVADGDGVLKDEIKVWIQANTSLNWADFFDRLEQFRNGFCRIKML